MLQNNGILKQPKIFGCPFYHEDMIHIHHIYFSLKSCFKMTQALDLAKLKKKIKLVFQKKKLLEVLDNFLFFHEMNF